MVGAVTRWTPVKNLTFSAEVLYFRLDQKFTGTAVLTPSAPKPATVYEYKNQDTVSLTATFTSVRRTIFAVGSPLISKVVSPPRANICPQFFAHM
jgi:hypothetical protein